MGKKSETKETLLIGFDTSIPRQKRVYEFLCQEKSEKGMAYNMIVHEALDVYMRYLSNLANIRFYPDRFVQRTESKTKIRKTKTENTPISIADGQEEEPIKSAQESLLSDDDIADPYLVEILCGNYGDEI